MTKNFKAIYNRVMESIAPKVKRAILNESAAEDYYSSRLYSSNHRNKRVLDYKPYSMDDFNPFFTRKNNPNDNIEYDYTSMVILSINKNAPTILGNLDLDYDGAREGADIKIWLGSDIATKVINNWNNMNGIGERMRGHKNFYDITSRGNKRFQINAGIKIIKPTFEFLNDMAHDFNSTINPACIFIELHDKVDDHLGPDRVFPILFFENGDTYMYASDAEHENSCSVSGFIKVDLKFTSRPAVKIHLQHDVLTITDAIKDHQI